MRDIGSRGDTELTNLSERADFFFPAPAPRALRQIVLRFPYQYRATLAARGVVILMVNDKIVAVRDAVHAHDGVLEATAGPDAIARGVLKVSVMLRVQPFSRRCQAVDSSALVLQVHDNGGVGYVLDSAVYERQIGAVATFPRALDLIAPTHPDARVGAAILYLAATAQDSRMVSAQEPSDPDRTRIHFAPAAPGPFWARVRPSFAVWLGGADLQGAARKLRVAGLSLQDGVAQVEPPGAVRFASLKAQAGVQGVAERGNWKLTIGAWQLPAGKVPRAIDLDYLVADDARRASPVISASYNGVLIGSAVVRTGTASHLRFDVPEGLHHLSDRVIISVTRQPREDPCVWQGPGHDAQVMPSSRLVLESSRAPREFFDLSSAFTRSLTIVTEQQPDLAALAALARILRGLVGRDTTLRFARSPGRDASAIVWLSKVQPASVEAWEHPAQASPMDRLATLSGFAPGQHTVAALMRYQNRPVLWISPGANFAELAGLGDDEVLDRGDIAALDSDSGVSALGPDSDLTVSVPHYPASYLNRLWQYRSAVILAVWAVASTWLAYVLVRRRHRLGGKL